MTEGMDRLPVRRLRGARQLTAVRLSEVDPNPHQPRKTFSDASIGELAESIARYGLLSPIIVRRGAGGRGSRRTRRRIWARSAKSGCAPDGRLP